MLKFPFLFRLILRRLAQLLPVIVLATVVVFGLIALVPGDPAITLAGENPTTERIAQIRTLYGLDKPLVVQYGNWLWRASPDEGPFGLVQGDSA